jgi:radical SAM protein with 4Fe4S-binding SPASM domain
MFNLSYEFAKLRTDYYLGGVQQQYRTGKAVPPPTYVIWDCTHRCNLACLHCGAVQEIYARELTTEQITGILNQLPVTRTSMFAVTGGEPLLRMDLPEVLSLASQRGFKTGIATNGFLIDRAAAEWIRDTRVYSIQISLDGPEKTHNRIRGNEESFTRAIQAIELLTRIKIPLLSVATTITTNNIHEIDDLRQVLIHLGVRLWRLTLVMPIGRAQFSNDFPDEDQLAWLLNYVHAYDSKLLHLYIGENLPFLGAWEKQIRMAPALCPIGFTACCIGVDGSLRGCPEQGDTADNREGSLLETPFLDIWQKGFGRYRNRDVLREDEKCSGCQSKYDCFGGCWVMRSARRHCIRELVNSPSLDHFGRVRPT